MIGILWLYLHRKNKKTVMNSSKISYSEYLYNSFNKYWNNTAYSDYPGENLTFGEVAEKVVQLHILFQELGINPGDRIAICGKNCTNWAVAFLAITTYGTVAVPLLHEYTPSTISYILDHSESRLLFVSDKIGRSLEPLELTSTEAIVSLTDFHLISAKGKDLGQLAESWEDKAASAILRPLNCHNFRQWIYRYDEEELLVLSYTSGTTSNPKGVMIPARSVASNITFAFEVMPSLNAGDSVISVLPLAHTYSMAFEFLAEFAIGAHVHFLVRPMHRQYIMDAFSAISPKVIIMVPLILEKIVQKAVLPILHRKPIKVLRSIPGSRQLINHIIKKKLINALGGNFYEIIVGGAALNGEVDAFLHEIKFPYTVGYGMTECSPIIGYSDWKEFKQGSCGKAAPRMEVKTLKTPSYETGEILTKGMNVMLGYYKNPDETARVIDKDGWLHTGDLGYVDSDGYIYIKGRCKTMILGPSGQNIFPEEIEEKLLAYSFIKETLVVERDHKVCALVYPDLTNSVFTNMSSADVEKYFSSFKKVINKQLSSYEQIAQIEVRQEEFQKTPKKSIIRYLYQ